MWPHRELPLPIMGIDLVVSNGEVRYFVADASPVTADRALPPLLDTAARALRAQFLTGVEPAELPEWGAAIFSDRVAAMRPRFGGEADLCAMYATALMRAYIALAPAVKAAQTRAGRSEIDAAHRRCVLDHCFAGPRTYLASARSVFAVRGGLVRSQSCTLPCPSAAAAAHANGPRAQRWRPRRYCVAQRSNTKTSSVLEKAFGHLGERAAKALASRYLFEVLFDHEFHYGVSRAFKEKLTRRGGPGDARGGVRAREGANAATEAVLQGVDAKQASKGSLRQ